MPVIGYPFWYTTAENEWKSLFFRYLPDWLTVNDLRILRGYYEGESNFHRPAHLQAWLWPIACWSTFLVVLVWSMLCLNAMIRSQWTYKERLTYPVIELPRAMVMPNSPIFRHRLFWTGFLIAATITTINGLHSIFPAFPALPTRRCNINYLLTDPPWNTLTAYGYIAVSFYPFMIGLGFLIPLDLSFPAVFSLSSAKLP